MCESAVCRLPGGRGHSDHLLSPRSWPRPCRKGISADDTDRSSCLSAAQQGAARRGQLARCGPSARWAAAPRFIAQGQGQPRAGTRTGRSYIDYVGSWGPHDPGPQPPGCSEKRCDDGACRTACPSAPPPRLEVEMAELMMRDGAAASRWCGWSTRGTEAVMSALRLARGGDRAGQAHQVRRAATTATPTRCWSRPAPAR